MSGARPPRKTNLTYFDCTKGVLALTGQWNALLSWCTPPRQCTLRQCNVPVVPGIVEGLQASALCMYSRSTAMLGNVTLPRPWNRLQHGVLCLANGGAHK